MSRRLAGPALALGVLLGASAACPPVPAAAHTAASAHAHGARAAVRRATVAVDGRVVDANAVLRPHRPPLVALAPLARAAHATFVATARGAQIGDGADVRGITVGSRSVREDGADSEVFDEPAQVLGGRLMLSATDAAVFFGLRLDAVTPRVAYSSTSPDQGTVEIVERPRPVVAAAAPATPPPAAPTSRTIVAGRDGAGTVRLEYQRDGWASAYHAGILAQGSAVRANVSAVGATSLGPPFGTVSVGPTDRSTSIGTMADPLGGLVLRSGYFDGADRHSGPATGSSDVFAGRRSDVDSLFGFTRTTDDGATQRTFAVATRDGKYEQSFMTSSRVRHGAWGTLVEQWLASERGAAAGFNLKTSGRLFLDATLTAATGGLPLGPNDAPRALTLGDDFSTTTTASLGFYAAHSAPFSPYAGLTTRAGPAVLGFGLTSRGLTGSVALNGRRAFGQLNFDAGPDGGTSAQLEADLQRATLTLDSTTSDGSTSASFEARTNHTGLNLLAGLGVANHRTGPIAGLYYPVSPALGVEATLRPGMWHGSALHLALDVGIPRRHPSPPTELLTVYAVLPPDAPASALPARLLIDGVRVATLQSSTTVRVTRGRHDVYVGSGDDNLGSPARNVDVEKATTIHLPLFPLRSVVGVVTIGPTRVALGPVSLGGIQVHLDSATATTDEDGAFAFPRAPYDPTSVFIIDPDTLPPGFAEPATVPLAAGGPYDVTLQSSHPVEFKAFP